MLVIREKRGRGQERVKGVKYKVKGDDLTSGGGHTMQYTDHVS